ncbi:MAG: ABC transporter ATP-binding protein [Candidatus Brocadiia bacterium]|jgi:putative ABC transport system ATP-binding protein|nr:ABC transporter ATP-binding protein [Candidatus Brocadiia bacterium]
MNIVELQDVRKTYAMGPVQVEALRGVSFAIEEGEYVAIMGPSGSGKSTLLNLLGCLDTATDGSYLLAGRDVSFLSDDALADMRRDSIGFVFQSFNLIPRLTVLENIGLPLFYAGMSGGESRHRAEGLAELVGLGHRIRHRPSELSGGELQRVAIARALANRPVMILADEPTGNLDSRTGQDILALLDEIWKKGATLIVVTHDADIGDRAQRTIRLADGELREDTGAGRGRGA